MMIYLSKTHAPRRLIIVGALICVSLLVAGTGPLSAQSITTDPDPGFVDYTGHYGEVFKLRGGWETKTSMRGDAEIINHYPSSKISFSDSLESFNPAPSDFVPENFTRYALIQLIIQARSDASSETLDNLKKLKIDELQSANASFRIIEHPVFGGLDGDWPPGTFEIQIDTPYRLSQLYTASPSYLCILTSGRDTPPSTVISRHYDWIRSSMRDWVASAPQPAPHLPSMPKSAPSGLAAEVVEHLKETKEYRELSSYYINLGAADPSWSESAQGQAVAAQIRIMLDDAASTRIVKVGKQLALQYSVGGQQVTDTGVIVADLKTDKDYRDFVAGAVASVITSNEKVQALLSVLCGQRAPGAGVSSSLTSFSQAAARAEQSVKLAIDGNHRATTLAQRLAIELSDGAAHEPGN